MRNKKRIFCLIDSINSGGAERQLTELAVLLSKQGYDINIGVFLESDFYLNKLTENHIKCIQLTTNKNKVLKVFSLIYYIIRNRPNTIIAYLDPPCISSCIAKLIYPNFKLIVSERNITNQLKLREYIKFNLYRFADYVVPNSNTQKQFIDNNFPFLRKKNYLITNCIDTDLFKPSENEKIRNENILNIIVVARVMPQKNPVGLIKAIKLLKDRGYKVKIRWFGYQKDKKYLGECQKLLKYYSLESIFSFIPPVSNIREEIIKSDALCLPSFYEGYPNVICEAMSCAIPVLCSNVSDNPLIVTDKINGYTFNPHNIEEIADSIIWLYQLNVEDRKKIGLANRMKVIKNNSQETFLNKYLNII